MEDYLRTRLKEMQKLRDEYIKFISTTVPYGSTNARDVSFKANALSTILSRIDELQRLIKVNNITL